MAEFWRDEEEPGPLPESGESLITHDLGCRCSACAAWFASIATDGRCKNLLRLPGRRVCGKPIDDHPKQANGYLIESCPS